jgi:membrane-associated phospholipid phosphatase
VPLRVRRCLTASGLTFVAFALIAMAWTQFVAVRDLDEWVAERLNACASSSALIRDTFLGVTYLGSARFLIGLSITVAALLLLLGRWRLAIAYCGTQLIAVTLIEHAKLFFERKRPRFNGDFVLEGGFSFPSGHALGSMVAFGMLAYLWMILIRWPRVRRCGVLVCIILIALIGGSRPVLGVHYLSDVLGGYTLGAAWLLLALALIEDIRGHYDDGGSSKGGAGQSSGSGATSVIGS